MEKIYDVVIIGGGPGGYTSALYCARAGLSTMVLEKLSAGGQMALTSQIDNYPGFEEGIDGFSLAEKMEQGAERFGAETELAEVLSVDFSNDIKIVESSEGTFKAKTVIIATGAVPRELGVPGEKELVGRGVGYCATCDGMFYRNKTVMVVGGGNTAAADAMTLSRICILPDAGRYALQRSGGRERNPVCLLPCHSHCRSPVPQSYDGQAFFE